MKFWDSIEYPENLDGCWIWKSAKGTNKRPISSYKNRSMSVPRIAWILTNGNIPSGMCVCHTCDTPPCCNPSHLFLGTAQDNVDDRERKGRNKMPLSKGEDHGAHRVTIKQVLEIRRLYNTATHTYRSLADQYGMTFGGIRKIIKRQTWGWLHE